MTNDLEAVKQLVVAELRIKSPRPVELLTKLEAQSSDALVKEAVLRLLQEHSIKMTADQRLELVECSI